jgi:hypothetical protein
MPYYLGVLLPKKATKRKNKKDISFLAVTALIIILTLILAVLLLAKVQVNSQPQSNPQPQYISKLKNLTAEYLYNSTTKKLVANVTINSVNNITLNISSAPQVGQHFYVNITYNGIFNFIEYNSSAYVSNIISIKYVGFYENGSSDMLVYNNRPNVSDYFYEPSAPFDYTPKNSDLFNYTAISFNITPTANASGKEWVFCGGEFVTYKNNSNWGNLFNNLTFEKKSTENSTVIDMISSKCVSALVR